MIFLKYIVILQYFIEKMKISNNALTSTLFEETEKTLLPFDNFTSKQFGDLDIYSER